MFMAFSAFETRQIVFDTWHIVVAGSYILEKRAGKRVVSQEMRRLTSLLMQVHFEGVKYAYPSRPKQLALQGVDLTIKSGQLVALVGLSGSGK